MNIHTRDAVSSQVLDEYLHACSKTLALAFGGRWTVDFTSCDMLYDIMGTALCTAHRAPLFPLLVCYSYLKYDVVSSALYVGTIRCTMMYNTISSETQAKDIFGRHDSDMISSLYCHQLH